MFTNQTFNYLSVENADRLPIPENIKKELLDFKWDKFVWNVFGLPAFQSTFSLSGTQLYFEKDSHDNIHVEQKNFTGQVVASGVLVPDKSDSTYYVTLELHFCNGVLCNSELIECKAQPRSEYEEGFKNFRANIDKFEKRKKSLWFRLLYKPYFHILSGLTLGIVFVCEFILKIFVTIVHKLLPIKL